MRSLFLERGGTWLAITLAAVTGLGLGCMDATGDGGGPSATLALQPVLPPSYTPGLFNLAIDRARIQLIRPPGQSVLDTTVFFPAAQSQLTVRLKVPLTSRREELTAAIELRSAQTLLFAGNATITLDEGGSVAPQIPMQYVGPGAEITRIEISPRDTALKPGDQYTFLVRAFRFTTPVEEFYVSWSSGDPANAPVTANGTMTAPGAPGSTTLRAVSPTGIRDSTVIAFSPPASTLNRTSGDGQTWVAGVQLPDLLVVQARAFSGQGVPGVRVRFKPLSGGVIRDTLVITDLQGYARTAAILGPVAGIQAFEASAPGLQAVGFTAIATIGPAARIEVLAGDQQTDTVGRTLRTPLIARVTDHVGNPVSGVAVGWQVIGGGGTLDRSSSTSNLSGIVFADYTLGTLPTQNRVRATMTTPPAAVDFVSTAVAGSPATLTVVQGSGQAGIVGTVLPMALMVRVTDAFGNLREGVAVRWSEVQGGGELSALSTPTNPVGSAQVSYRLPGTPGTYNVVADIQGTPLTVLFSVLALPAP
ncbi:MAG: Ig-like domain-containing protein [Gemmatimonadota bacterium]